MSKHRQYRKHTNYKERVVAKSLDLLLLGIVFDLIVLFLPIQIKIYYYSTSLMILGIILWILIEAVLVTLFGTTPGKYFFNIKIINTNNKKLSFFYSFNRSFRIIFRSYLLLVPQSFNTSYYNTYGKGKIRGQSIWDYPDVLVLSNSKNNDKFIVGIAILIGMLIVRYILARISLTIGL